MNRSNFGQWGLELNDTDFARALASLGVLHQGHRLFNGLEEQPIEDAIRLSVWALALTVSENRVPLTHAIDLRRTVDEKGNVIPARVFADAWSSLLGNFPEASHNYSSLRLEVHPPDLEFLWLIDQLSNVDAVGATSVYVRSDEPSVSVNWNWPIRIGFLANEPSQKLRDDLELLCRQENYWLGALIEFVTLNKSNEFCNLLLMPSVLREAVADLLAASAPIRADCVMVLGGYRETAQTATLLSLTLRSLARTAGLAVVQVKPENRVSWFAELIRELSHDENLDVALFRACRLFDNLMPLLLASRKLIYSTRIARNVAEFAERLKTVVQTNELIELKPEEGESLNIPTRMYLAHELGKSLEENAKDFVYDSERGTASAYVNLRQRARPVLANITSTTYAPRWIQAQVFYLRGDGTAIRLRRAVRAGACHVIVMRVGRESSEWEMPPEEFNFPSQHLPPDKTEHELTVVFSEPQLLSEPATAVITLPRFGDSTVCQFLLYVQEGVEAIEARITILYRNRVLQTALLRARVLPEPLEASEDFKIRIDPETAVRPGMAGLGNRRDFDVAFVVNQDATNTHGVMAVADRSAYFRSPANLKEFNDSLDNSLSDITANPNKYTGDLRSAATIDLLRTFARWGSQFYEDIMLDRVRNDFISRAKRIQVVSADPETRLPLEFCYEREAPAKDADLCPHAEESLSSGECRADCPAKNQPRAYFCPLGFWGFSKVIERHMHQRGSGPELLTTDFGLQAEPFGDRNRLDVLNGVLIGASDNASNYEPEQGAAAGPSGVTAILGEVRKLWSSAPDPVKTWQEWLDEVESGHPTTLILLTHTIKKADDPIAALAIRDGKADAVRLDVVDIIPEFLSNPKTETEPLVLLIGCETGVADISFFNFVSKFRRMGAGIVICTGVKVRGRHAVPITMQLVELLGDFAQKKSTSIGDVMLIARRRMLARGIPIVLTLMAFGDADWQIGIPNSGKVAVC